MTEDGEVLLGILLGDIVPWTVIVRGKQTIRQGWRKDRDAYFKTGHGTSLWDKKGVFGYPKGCYFLLPEGTRIPASLKVVEGNWSDRFNATLR